MSFLYLNNACALNGSIRFRVLQALGFSLFVFFFLFFFRPFGIEAMQAEMWLIALGFALATFIPMVVINVLIPPLFKPYFNEEKWTVGKEIFWTLVNVSVIGLCNYLFFSYVSGLNFSLSRILWFQGSTMAVGVFPITILTLWRESRDRKKFSEEAVLINKAIDETHDELIGKELSTLTIPSQNTSETLSLKKDDFLFIQSSDNYLDVFYLKNEQVKKQVLRNTLKAVSENLSAHENLFRCHKSYLVNLDKVKHISGNAQGYKLHLHNTEEVISVSRQHNETIKSLLAVRH